MSQTFEVLQGHQYMSLTTFRKNGAAVSVPVWFAEAQGKLYMLTLHSAGKLKRIRNNPRVQMAPCDARGKVLGESATGTARILSAAEGETARQHLKRKYGWLFSVFAFFTRVRGGNTIYLEIAPAKS